LTGYEAGTAYITEGFNKEKHERKTLIRQRGHGPKLAPTVVGQDEESVIG